jgi:hypothetical protein
MTYTFIQEDNTRQSRQWLPAIVMMKPSRESDASGNQRRPVVCGPVSPWSIDLDLKAIDDNRLYHSRKTNLPRVSPHECTRKDESHA